MMLAVNLDSSGVVGIVGILATFAALVITRRFDLRVFEKRVETERQNARMQFERDLVREHHRLKLDAYTAFLGAEARFFFVIQRNGSTLELGSVIAEATEALVRVRLVSSQQLQNTVTAFWTTSLDVLSTRLRSRQEPTVAAADATMKPILEARRESLHVLEKAMMSELETILRESENDEKTALISPAGQKLDSSADFTSVTD
jgi:hypothetical protein